MSRIDSMEIRVMTIEDYDGVYSLWKRTPGMGLGRADTLEGIQRFLLRNPGLSFVAIEDERIIGTALGGHDGRKGYIFHAAVDKECQGRGIGKQLMERVIEALGAEGVPRLSLLVYKDNSQGNEFWQRTGWQKRSDVNYYTLDLPS
jgi:ribosomal protein S18 acetylase RimI-like enzyme